MTITIVLPIPPTGTNKMWAPVRTNSGAKLVSSAAYAAWKAMAKREVESQREGISIAGKFRVAILIPESGFDSDAPIKPALDACQAGGAIKNDKHCIGGSWDVDDTRAGTVLIVLTPIPPTASAPRRNTGNARKEPTS